MGAVDNGVTFKNVVEETVTLGGEEVVIDVAEEKDEVIKPAGGEGTADKSGDDASAREEKRVDDSNAIL